MKKIYLLIGCVLLVGCTSKSSVEPEETVIPTIEPTAEITPEPTKETVDYEFKTVSVNGLFNVRVREPLPDQMVFEIKKKDEKSGWLEFIIKSSVTVPCEFSYAPSTCDDVILSIQFGIEEELETGGNADSPVTEDAMRMTIERESEETIYVWRCWMCGYADRIEDGGGPDYYYEDNPEYYFYSEEELISFDVE